MNRLREEFDIWGSTIFFDIASMAQSKNQLLNAVAAAANFFTLIDNEFSTYKESSYISRLRRSEISLEETSALVQEVWRLCLIAREITDGAFDPWAVAGGFDPSGYVKGWAGQRGAEIICGLGGDHIQINAAGDLILYGGDIQENHEVIPWVIGIQHPELKNEVAKVFNITTGAIATSGTYERGSHITNPFDGLIAIGARSATVLGPDGGVADALATALIVAGKDGARWFTKPELSEYSAWVVDRNSDTTWSTRAPRQD